MAATLEPVTLENAICPVCQRSGVEVFRQRDYFCNIAGEFGQRRCSHCETYFLSPRPAEEAISQYYPKTYVPYQKARRGLADRLAESLGIPFVRRRIVQRFVQRGRILDVGCGNGAFLATMSHAWELFAMDIQQPPEFAYPVTFFAGRIDHEAPPIDELDAITLWHVFEHLYHPETALRHAAAMLKPDGVLFIAIPDLQCLERRLFGKYWVGWDPPRHAATYSRRGLENLLSRAGLRLVDVVPDQCGSYLLGLNLEFVLRGLGIHRNVHESKLLRAILTPCTIIANWMGLAPAKVYVARK